MRTDPLTAALQSARDTMRNTAHRVLGHDGPTAQQLEQGAKRLDKLLAEATAGPWEAQNRYTSPGRIWQAGKGGGPLCDVRAGPRYREDTALIVAAVNSLPSLIAQIKELREALEILASDEPLDHPQIGPLVQRRNRRCTRLGTEDREESPRSAGMTGETEPSSLLERVRGAKGADRGIDGELWAMFDPAEFERQCGFKGMMYAGHVHTKAEKCERIATLRTLLSPQYTASLDAAIALVERVKPGAAPRLLQDTLLVEPGDSQARFWKNGSLDWLPLALLAALLSSMQEVR